MLASSSEIVSQIKIDFQEYNLQNGLHVILHQDKTNPIVTVDVWYHVGSKDEEPNKTGFAHLFEHMMFQGSENVGKTGHFKYIQDAGGTLNGSTTQDRTNYFESLPSNQLELALWLESDRMNTLKVNEENFNNQREVVKEEKRQRYDNVPYGERFYNLFKRAYNNHPYHWITIGSMDDLNNSKLQDAQRFYKKYYCPNNAVLTITGDIEYNDTRQLVDKYFGNIKPSNHINRNYPPDTFHQGEKLDTVYDNIQLPAIYIAYKIPPLTSPENDAFDLLSNILSNGKSSRLYKNLVYEKKLVKSINAFNYDLEIGGLFVISSTGFPKTNLNEVQIEIDKEIDELINNNVTEWELTKAKNITETNFVNKTQSLLGKAEMLNTFYTFFKNTSRINSEIDKILSVTSENIKKAVNQFFKKDNRVILYYLPKNNHNSK